MLKTKLIIGTSHYDRLKISQRSKPYFKIYSSITCKYCGQEYIENNYNKKYFCTNCSAPMPDIDWYDYNKNIFGKKNQNIQDWKLRSALLNSKLC